MASEVDICNLALANLGDEATLASIDPPEGSAQADHCARFYPLARDEMLDSHPWFFCTTRAALPALSAVPLMGWQYAYGVPSDVMNYLSIHLPTETSDMNPQEFELETLADGSVVLYANIPTPVLRYTRRVTDPSKYQPAFIQALAWLLSSKLSGPLIRGDEGRKASRDALATHVALLGIARTSDAAQRRVLNRRLPEHLAARTGSSVLYPR